MKNRRNAEKKQVNWSSFSIQTKLILTFLLTVAVVILANLFLYGNMNGMLNRIDQVYQSNVNLNELSDTLQEVQRSVTDYLSTKSSESLERYYAHSERLSAILWELNAETVDDEILIVEKSARSMGEEYLQITDEAIQAKRGRNIEKYGSYYEEAEKLFTYINSYIYSLNNKQFQYNSENYEELMVTFGYLETMNLLVLILVGILNLLLIYGLTKTITNPLLRLVQAANEVAEGNLDVELEEVHSGDEVGIVTRAFRQMLESLRSYIERIRENMEKENEMKEKALLMEAHLKDARLKYLQAQINPHFLFNTLNAGAQLAMLEGAEKTTLFVENMAEFFRYNLKKSEQDATLQEELDLVDSYIYILNVRFSGEIKYEKHVEGKWDFVRVPSMILQPIVENAVNYGIRGIDWEGKVTLSVYEEEEQICISIRDNGIGISKEKIQDIFSGNLPERDSASNSNGIGLLNVISRLQLYYSREKVLDIVSGGENQGTEVILYIPRYSS